MSIDAAAQVSTEAAGSVATDSTGVLDTKDAPATDTPAAGVLDGDDGAGEAKPTETEDADKPAKAEVPEAYEFKMPDGMQLDSAVADVFTPLFKEDGLSNEQAQRYVDKYVEMQKAQAEQIQQFYINMDAEARKIPAEVIGLAKKALQIAPEEAAEIKADMYMRSNPKLIRYLSKIGKLAAEAQFREGAAKAGGSPATFDDVAKGLYDKR